MPRFLVDEDLPRSLARLLREAAFSVEDVRDVGLRGRSDDEVFRYATSNSLTLLTGDLGFANILRFPLSTHSGIIVVRFPNELPATRLNQAILDGLRSLGDEEYAGSLAILEPGRVRLRRSAVL
jgi:predicted nuclease of predicted toxin-antitoxin system